MHVYPHYSYHISYVSNQRITGLAGSGFLTLAGQSVNPPAPPAGALLLHAATTNGFTRMEQDNEAGTNLIYGRDNVFIARNTSGASIPKGSAVYVTGSTGNVPNIALARANSSTTLPSVAIALDTIANNAFGQVMTLGIISGFDTSAFAVGASVWVSTTVAGALTSTRPSGLTNFVQRVGSSLVSGVGNGSLLVSIAPAVLNMETGTTAPTWTGSAVVCTTLAASSSVKSSSATAGIGYDTGAGGTVAQATSKATGVTLSKVCGTITMNAAALAADTTVSFVLTNTAIAATDYVAVQHDSVGTLGAYTFAVTPAAGSATISVHNCTPGSLSQAIGLRFVVIKAVTS